ncbi:hypothetical protein BGM19_26800 [Streptomyces agglomeratus]|uniref:ImmA/IrrE family metallo-endopeptidase n=1 Tax=Streptomyces agglomeratus TaxID=285458 RepID=UPI00086BDE84|nr:ImmA/IrrE family metallo-endopeptidase [Streptomyces agglomeratus]OEJ61086.1 hypothetical protein BGM19_26800 [Streptomyces agglomeratus]
MAFRRGFKTEANALALNVRAELDLRALDRLDPLVLAECLGIPVVDLSELATSSSGAQYLLSTEPDAFSAATVFAGTMRTIVHNDAHTDGRISSNLAHECAHGLLLHPPTPALDDRGCRQWDQDIEDEAQYLAGALLVTEDAALAIARSGRPLADAATQLGVSEQMIRYRLNITGAVKRVSRARSASRGA